LLAELATRSDAARKVHDSYVAFRARTAPWSRVSIRAVLEARGEGSFIRPRQADRNGPASPQAGNYKCRAC
jgi:hypothetical protein